MTVEFTTNVDTAEPPASTLLAAFPGPGMAAVSAHQYIIERLGLQETGHVQVEGIPAVTPYEDGRPHHHTRLFSKPGFDYTILLSELPIPIQFSEPFGRDIINWIDTEGVKEVALLTAIPSLNSSEKLAYVASEDYHRARLQDSDSSMIPLSGGFLTGVNASLISRSMNTSLRVGVLATGANPWQPLDGEATLRLVEGVADLYNFSIGTSDLRTFANRTRQHYEQLAAQVEAHQQEQTQVAPEDYGYM